MASPKQDKARRLRHSIAQTLLGGIGVALLTLVCERLQLNLATTALLYLIVILLLSLTGNFASSALVSIFAVVCLSYLFDLPLSPFGSGELVDVVALIAFLATAFVISRLIARVRESLREVQAANEALRRSEVYLSEAQRLSHTGSWAWDVVGREYLHWSPEHYRIFGLDSAQGPPSFQAARDRIHPEDRPNFDQAMERAVRERTDFQTNFRVVLPDGSTKYVHIVGSPVVSASGDPVELVGTVMDVTERKRAERAIRQARERTLQARFAAVLDERTRLARDIHDTLLQGFTGVALKLVAAISRVVGPPETVASLREVVRLAQETLADARRAVWDLRSPALAGGDFLAALRTAAEDGVRGAGLALDFEVGGSPRPVSPEVETVVARVAQEAIANVVKHAAARTVRVRLSYEVRGVRLSVIDDGRGFAVDPGFRAYGGHWGLLGMRERASHVRGKLSVRSAPGYGTKIVLLAPYAGHGHPDTPSGTAGEAGTAADIASTVNP